MPILTCEGRKGHKHFKGDPFVIFLKELQGLYVPHLMLVYLALQLFF
jgi:hypothetical protein